MKAFPSFHSVKNEKKPSISSSLYGNFDLTQDREDRRDERKLSASKGANQCHDEVFFQDLDFTSNYAEYFKDCITPGLSLNIKGILANLHFKFKVVDEIREPGLPIRVR